MTNRKPRLIQTHAFHPGEGGTGRCQQVYRPGDRPCGREADAHRWVGVEAVRAVHPPTEDVFTHPVRVAGATVAVDRAGCLVLTVPNPGSFTITNLDAVIADLELARAHARRYERNPEHYRPEAAPDTGRQCCEDHAPVEDVQCCDDCPAEVEQAAAEVAAGLTAERRAEIEARALADADAMPLDVIDAMVNDVLTDEELSVRLAVAVRRATLPVACPDCGSTFPSIRVMIDDDGTECLDPTGWHRINPTEEEIRDAADDVRHARRNTAPPVDTIVPTNVL